MHPPHPHGSPAPYDADRSLASTLATSVVTVVAFSAALAAATTAATIVPGPPTLVASVALVVGFATVLAAPIGAALLGRRLLESLRRRGRPPTVADQDRPDPRPTKG
jgi:hypothetical protein